MNLIPTIIEKNDMGERAYDIYSRLLKDRIIILNGEINDNTANVVVAEFLYLDSLNILIITGRTSHVIIAQESSHSLSTQIKILRIVSISFSFILSAPTNILQANYTKLSFFIQSIFSLL